MLTKHAYSTIGIPLIPGAMRWVRPETTCATLLFADMRGYDTLAQRLPAAEVAPLLEEFFAVLTCAVLECGGRIFHLAQADMMAGFGVGDIRHTQIAQTLMTARMIQRRFALVRAAWQSKYSVDTAVGIGIHRGEVAAGEFGPREQTMLTLVGDATNIAGQLCRRARAGEILLSSAAYPSQPLAAVGLGGSDSMPLKLLPKLQLRGRAAPMDAWCAPLDSRLQMRQGLRARA
jgi:class 3 adenylate cyclase